MLRFYVTDWKYEQYINHFTFYSCQGNLSGNPNPKRPSNITIIFLVVFERGYCTAESFIFIPMSVSHPPDRAVE